MSLKNLGLVHAVVAKKKKDETIFSLRLSPALLTEIWKAAQVENLTVSAFIRRAVQRDLIPPPLPTTINSTMSRMVITK